VPPGKQTLGPFRAQQLLVDEKFQDLPGEDLVQPRVVKRAHPLEDDRNELRDDVEFGII
jgi:hypothetical protein